MKWRRSLALAAAGLLAGGCSLDAYRKSAWASETICKHCNCLMPAGTDMNAKCTVCDCGYIAHQCRRDE